MLFAFNSRRLFAAWGVGLLLFACGVQCHAASPVETEFPLWDGHESVQQYAERVGLPPARVLELSHGVRIECVLIPAGEFVMGWERPEEPGLHKQYVGLYFALAGPLLLVVLIGRVHGRARQEKSTPRFSLRRFLAMTLMVSIGILGFQHWRASGKAWGEFMALDALYDESNLNERPAHRVLLRRPFYMGKTEVTQAQFGLVMGSLPHPWEANAIPVYAVPHEQAQAFCRKAGRIVGETLALPTEEQWEFACRAGTETQFHSGNGGESLDLVAWHGGNARGSFHPVARKQPNHFGLFDMHGNVAEWCADYYRGPYDVPRDTPLPKWEVPHVVRGGSIISYDKCGSRARDGVLSSIVRPGEYRSVGIRIVIPVEGNPRKRRTGGEGPGQPNRTLFAAPRRPHQAE